MLHPVLHLLATQPRWLAEHAEAYVQLTLAELEDAAAAGRRAVLLAAVALGAACVAATLAGVALMLWAVLPALPASALQMLWAAPALPLCLALAAGAALWRRPASGRFADLQQQVQADLALLRDVAAP